MDFILHLPNKNKKMKKIFFVALAGLVLSSCGKEKQGANKIDETNQYVVTINAIYPEDDSLVVVYKKDTYFQYEKPLHLKVKGGAGIQALSVSLPETGLVENLEITMSTNKSQKKITLQNILIKNKDKEVYNISNQGQNLTDYFDLNKGMILNNDGTINLNFDGEYPPGMTGNPNLEDQFLK